MKILIITQYFWPESFKINDLASGLIDRGHEVSVLTGKPNYPIGKFYKGYHFFGKSIEFYNSIKIIRVGILPRGQNNKIKLSLNYLSFILMASIKCLLTFDRPDIIFVYQPSPITVCLPALLLKRKLKSPVILWVQDLWPESILAVDAINNKILLKWIKKLVNYIYNKCDYILVSSKGYFPSIMKHNIVKEKINFFPQTAETCYQPIDPNLSLLEHNQLPIGFRIIFSGNIGIAQDIETILDAAEILKSNNTIKWIFIGDGSRRSWLQDQIFYRQLDKTVYWLGSYPTEKIPYFLSVADALLITLKADPLFSLTIPAKLQSYLACGKPIMAAVQGETKKIIEEGEAGLVSPSGNSEGLAEMAIKMQSLSIDNRKKMGLNSRKYFDEHFDRNRLLMKLEKWMHIFKEKNYQ